MENSVNIKILITDADKVLIDETVNDVDDALNVILGFDYELSAKQDAMTDE